ncbi:hypothetical protein AAC387_Pa02g1163 [Persea americana]
MNLYSPAPYAMESCAWVLLKCSIWHFGLAQHQFSCTAAAKYIFSFPGVERIVQIPQELEWFKDFPMYVKYVTEEAATESSKESGGVLNLASLDLESSYCCIWNIADVRKNREQAGRGRPLSRKQRVSISNAFDSLHLVHICKMQFCMHQNSKLVISKTKRFLINAMAHARLF